MTETLRIAVVQSRIEPDIRRNGSHIRQLMEQAAAQGARLALFPEGALSGYAKAQVRDWDGLDWPALEGELSAIGSSATALGITAVIGSAHPIAGRRPHNSLFALPDGPRYDKRRLSHTEVTGWYTPGRQQAIVHQSGFAFGVTLCIEVQFPELFMDYEAAGVDGVLHASYGLGSSGEVILQAHAATNCLWLAVATPANAADPPSGIIGPDGQWLARCGTGIDIAVAELDRHDPRYEIALTKARPWRRRARQGEIYSHAL
ncbi:MAG TPA: carbon-nitrogen hydrolase family protein [Devosia sp.]|jgi:predicted amidohydrolase|nr:carbon-nitrogen hydrolase family protein [Devosia sp.]